MPAEIRPVRLNDDTDRQAAIDCCARTFLSADVEDWTVEWDLVTEADRRWVADDAGTVCGTCGIFTMELTLPGGVVVPAGGVTWISVAADHRRQGLLSGMLRLMEDQMIARGEPVSILTASEGGIYRRFGYGRATRHHRIVLDTRVTRFRDDLGDPGAVRNVSAAEARSAFPALHDRWRRGHPGEIGRTEPRWDLIATRAQRQRHLHARHPDGYCTFSFEEAWRDGRPGHRVRVQDLVALTAEAELALWHYVCSLDLVGEVHATVPFDHPLPWWVTDPRQVRVVGAGDHLWVRPLDVARLLSARRYPAVTAPTTITVDVTDRRRPEVGGRFRLDIDGTGTGTCTRLHSLPDGSADADLVTDSAGLGTLLLGGWRPSHLVSGRLATTADPSRLPALDALFGSDIEPSLHSAF